MILQRSLDLFRRNIRAYKLGISYGRGRSFETPSNLVISGERKTLSLPNDNGTKIAFVDLLIDDCYGLQMLSKPISTILDIGGHVGLFGLAARSKFPNATIHTYEPNPNLEKYLQTQAQIGKFSYFMEAVGLEDGNVSLDIQEDSVLTKVYRSNNGEIPQISFRNAINRLGNSIDLIKLDCEGAEWEIFQDQDAWQSVKHLTMEYHLWPTLSHDEAEKAVQHLGFKIAKQSRCHEFDGIIIGYR